MANDFFIQQEKDYSIMLLIGEIDKIRKQHGAYIWAYPIKWRDKNNITQEVKFGWEIEFENGFCTNIGYGSDNFSTYQEALESAISYFETNPQGDRNIYPAIH